MTDKLHIAVFVSGRGSNFQAILRSIKEGSIRNAEIVVVISSTERAGACEVALQNGIPTVTLTQKSYESENGFCDAMLATLASHGVNFIALAGYMKKVPDAVIRQYRNRIINVHPALLPKFGGKGMFGMHVHEAVIANGELRSGATVHLVDEEYDRGPIILQRSIDVSPDETPEHLAEKVLRIEHEIYPEAIRLFAEGKVKINQQVVTIDE